MLFYFLPFFTVYKNESFPMPAFIFGAPSRGLPNQRMMDRRLMDRRLTASPFSLPCIRSTHATTQHRRGLPIQAAFSFLHLLHTRNEQRMSLLLQTKRIGEQRGVVAWVGRVQGSENGETVNRPSINRLSIIRRLGRPRLGSSGVVETSRPSRSIYLSTIHLPSIS